ncbi:mitotic spindle assembly checkpoint protein-like protein MAD1 [Trichodelitschia bisporula]|uniref:Spindle assembly checkpoint component MAD1 n=1 Tax=Trichodelitschia bisporula TaxID=703511 RepID=A0A6G1I2G5_9PEZI|nr:mitotic spindle assembly checkpoint protein-like protein MAD1 [Trichodelitschia bisporula]
MSTEDLRARIHSLEYEISTLKRDKEVAVAQHVDEARLAEERFSDEYRRSQQLETSVKTLTRRNQALQHEFNELQTRSVNEKAELEHKFRNVSNKYSALEEEMGEIQEQVGQMENEIKRQAQEAESKQGTQQQMIDQLRGEVESRAAALQAAQHRLTKQEEEVHQLEAQVLGLKSRAGEADGYDVIKQRLSEQVAYIKKLEHSERTQSVELKELRNTRMNIKLVEEQKRDLQGKLRLMDNLRQELAEAQNRVQVLEDEKRAWESYLESQQPSEGEFSFESPEDMARAFMQERVERISLLDQLGAIKPELTVKDAAIRHLEELNAQLRADLTKQAPQAQPPDNPADARVRARLERARDLAMKEVELLRAQLKAFDGEVAEFHPEQYTAQCAAHIKSLEDLLDESRKDAAKLHDELTKIEIPDSKPSGPQTGSKRPLENDEGADERLGELLRKSRHLQDKLAEQTTRISVLERELKAKSSQLSALKAASRTRVLELRDNPTNAAAAIKQSTLTALSAENASLKALLTGDGGGVGHPLVPLASLEAMELKLAERDTTIASRDKKIKRLTDIFAAKAGEFRDVVFSLIGWKLDFMPNGRVKATSMYYPSASDDAEADDNYIIFDGEAGTMKVSGGPQSEFAREIRGLIEFWVDTKGQVPCFLAAMTLEFFERYAEQVQ